MSIREIKSTIIYMSKEDYEYFDQYFNNKDGSVGMDKVRDMIKEFKENRIEENGE